jgi:hypothetical protein
VKDVLVGEWSVLEIAYAAALDRQLPLPKARDHDMLRLWVRWTR